ncbi:unnamed protein product [Heterobilharzia americana]|nr:unnamed protein product [Heterobilharzia americana]
MSPSQVSHSVGTREELIRKYQNIVEDVSESDEASIKAKEQAILDLGNLLAENKDAKALADLIIITRPFLKLISKAKAGRLVRTLVDLFLDLEGGTGREVDLCRDCIEWANQERRVFLRQALETRLMGLYYDNGSYEEALKLGSSLYVS